jgi:hypothetical protein
MKKYCALVLVVLLSLPAMTQGKAVGLILNANDTILAAEALGQDPIFTASPPAPWPRCRTTRQPLFSQQIHCSMRVR